MDRAKIYALDAAKEITISRVSNTTIGISANGGKDVAEFFEAIYKKVLELAESETT